MQQAITAPVLGSIALGGLLLGWSALQDTHEPACVTRQLVLHAEERPDAIYLSAFRDNVLTIGMTEGSLPALRFEVRARIFDGCEWLGIETLEPLDSTTYAYDYSEVVLSCEPGAVPTRKTPRTGYVTVH
jgi:hypothetical protein